MRNPYYRPMTHADLVTLKKGDIVKHTDLDRGTYVVTGNYGDHVTAVRSVDITNFSEWLIFDPEYDGHEEGSTDAAF